LAVDRLLGHRRPFVVNHLVTVRCNLRCPFCYVSGPEQQPFNRVHYPKSSELTAPAIADFYRELIAAQFRIAIVLGGEPLLRTDLDEMLRVLKGHVFTTVFTNGFLLGERAELLRNANTVFVSIDAPDSQHDELRASPGAFEKATAGIEALRTGHPAVHVALNMTVTRRNAHRIRDMLSLARRLDLPIGFQPPSYRGQFEVDGRPHERSEAQAAEREAVMEAFREVKAAARLGARVIGSDTFFDHVIRDEGAYRCWYPTYALGPVLPNGDVIGCTSSGVIGNVASEPLSAVLSSRAFQENAKAGATCPYGCRDWGIHDLSAIFDRRFTMHDGRRYFRTFVSPARQHAAAGHAS
jgi:MoaA/NifB/PqqE/SkfB family radical SAM enzyme